MDMKILTSMKMTRKVESGKKSQELTTDLELKMRGKVESGPGVEDEGQGGVKLGEPGVVNRPEV
jgi:hypothetical protein